MLGNLQTCHGSRASSPFRCAGGGRSGSAAGLQHSEEVRATHAVRNELLERRGKRGRAGQARARSRHRRASPRYIPAPARPSNTASSVFLFASPSSRGPRVPSWASRSRALLLCVGVPPEFPNSQHHAMAHVRHDVDRHAAKSKTDERALQARRNLGGGRCGPKHYATYEDRVTLTPVRKISAGAVRTVAGRWPDAAQSTDVPSSCPASCWA